MIATIVRQATLDYEIVFGSLMHCPPHFSAGLLVQPRVAGMRREHRDDDLAIDLVALARSLAVPGNSWLLTCSCGYGPDAEVNAPIDVEHPDSATILWHLNSDDHADLFEEAFAPDVRITLRFDRARYTATVDALIADVASWLAAPVPVDRLRQLQPRSIARGGHMLDADEIGNATELLAFFDPMDWSTGDDIVAPCNAARIGTT